MLVLCCLKLGGARGQAERGELVFLQVPGFKKLQAFLHSQAFLQTLGETKDRERWGTGGRRARGGSGAEAVRNGLLGGGLVGHAEREHTVMEGGALRQGEIANEPGDEPEANERHIMLQAGLADLGMTPGAHRALLDGAVPVEGAPGRPAGICHLLKPQDAEQDLQAGPSLPPTPLRHPWGQSWLHSVQDSLKKPWKLLCAARDHLTPSLTPPWDSPKPKMSR